MSDAQDGDARTLERVEITGGQLEEGRRGRIGRRHEKLRQAAPPAGSAERMPPPLARGTSAVPVRRQACPVACTRRTSIQAGFSPGLVHAGAGVTLGRFCVAMLKRTWFILGVALAAFAAPVGSA